MSSIICLVVWSFLGFGGFILTAKLLDSLKLDFDSFSSNIQILLLLPFGPIVWCVFVWLSIQDKLSDPTTLNNIKLKLYKEEFHKNLLEEKERLNKQLAIKKQ